MYCPSAGKKLSLGTFRGQVVGSIAIRLADDADELTEMPGQISLGFGRTDRPVRNRRSS